jgi:hypothetical protein
MAKRMVMAIELKYSSQAEKPWFFILMVICLYEEQEIFRQRRRSGRTITAAVKFCLRYKQIPNLQSSNKE